jgi:hypothetical protein
MNAAVKPAMDRKDLRKKAFRTKDIIKLVQEVIKTDVAFYAGYGRPAGHLRLCR